MSTCSDPPSQRCMFLKGRFNKKWQLSSFTHSNFIPNLYDLFAFHQTQKMFRRMFTLLFSIQNKKTKKVSYYHNILSYYNFYGVFFFFFVILKPRPQSPFTFIQKEQHEHPAKYLLLWKNRFGMTWGWINDDTHCIFYLNNDSFNVIHYRLSEPKLCNLWLF